MYHLDAFAEIHSYHKVRRTLRGSRLDKAFLDKMEAHLNDTVDRAPKSVAGRPFWDELESAVEDEMRRTPAAFDGNLVVRAIYQDVVLREAVETARYVWQREFDAIDSGRYATLYHEGRFGKPVCPYAESVGLDVVYLGRGNPFHDALINGEVPEDDEATQTRREGIWLGRIRPSHKIERSLLIAGDAHVRNKFGLADNLHRKGIRVRELTDFNAYSDNLMDRFMHELADRLNAEYGLDRERALGLMRKIIVVSDKSFS